MKKLKLIALCATFTTCLIIIACKKNADSKPNPMQENFNLNDLNSSYQFNNLKHVPQKFLNLNSSDFELTIKRFKSAGKAHDQAARLVDIDSLSLDSATWVMEAVLNYDFDFQSNETYNKFYFNLSTTIAINDNSLKVNSNDLESVYEILTSRIDSLINDSIKVGFINVEGYVFDPGTSTGIFGLKVQLINSSNVITCHVPSYFISGTSPYVIPTSPAYYNTHFGCNPTGNVYNACSLLNNSANCFSPYYSGGCGRWFWSSITPGASYYPDYSNHTNNYTTAVFYSGQQSNSSFCPPITLTSTQVDNYYYGAISLGNSTAPSGYVLLAFGYAPQGIAIHTGSQSEFGWDLLIQHAIRKCVSENDQ